MVPKTLLTDRLATDIVSYVNAESNSKSNNKKDFTDPTYYLHTTTAEGSHVTLDAMIFWRIVDTEKAAKNAMEMLKINEENEMARYNNKTHSS